MILKFYVKLVYNTLFNVRNFRTQVNFDGVLDVEQISNLKIFIIVFCLIEELSLRL